MMRLNLLPWRERQRQATLRRFAPGWSLAPFWRCAR